MNNVKYLHEEETGTYEGKETEEARSVLDFPHRAGGYGAMSMLGCNEREEEKDD